MAHRTPQTPTPFDRLDAIERAGVLSALLDEQPSLRADVERLAVQCLEDAPPDGVADEVEWALDDLELDDLAGRAGRQPGRGYVHENEAAFELVEEAMQPFVDDLRRRAALGMAEAAAGITLGVLTGLYRCRDVEDGTVLGYAGPDTTGELASWVIDEAARAGLELPAEATDAACPDWAPLS